MAQPLIDSLISKAVFQEFSDYQKALQDIANETIRTVSETEKLAQALANSGTNTQGLQAILAKQVELENRLNKAEQERITLTNRLLQEEQKRIELENKLAQASAAAAAAAAAAANAANNNANANNNASNAANNASNAANNNANANANNANAANNNAAANTQLANILAQAAQTGQLTEQQLQAITAALMNSSEVIEQRQRLEEAGINTLVRLAASESDEAEALALVQNAVRQRNRELQQQIRIDSAATGSIDQLGAMLNQLRTQYAALSEVDREGAIGINMLDQINELSERYNGLRESMGQFQHLVGNYQNSIQSALGVNNGFAASLLNILGVQTNLQANTAALAQQMANATNGFQRGVIAVKAFGKQLLALLANPIVLILAGIVAVFKLFSDAIQSSEENTKALSRILAPLKGIFNLIRNAIETLVGVVLKGVEAVLDFGRGLLRLAESLPFVGDAIKVVNDRMQESIDLELRSQRLKDEEDAFTLERAKLERDIAQAREDFRNEELYGIQERFDAIQSVFDKEKRIVEEEIRLKREQFEIQKAIAAQAGNTEEENDALVEMEADLIRAETAYSNRIRQIHRFANTARKELNTEILNAEKARVSVTLQLLEGENAKYQQIAKDQKKSLEERTAAYTAFTANQAKAARANADLEIKSLADTQDRASKEQLIRIKLQQQLSKLEADSIKFIADERLKLDKAVNDALLESSNLRYSIEQTRLSRIVSDERNSYAARTKAAEAYTESIKKQLIEQRDAELANVTGPEEVAAVQRANIQSKYDNQIEAEQNRHLDDMLKAREAYSDKLIVQVRTDAQRLTTEAQIAAQKELNALSDQYAKGLLSREEYERKKEEVTIRYNKQIAQIEVSLLEQSLKNFQGTADQRLKLEKEIADARLKIEQDTLKAIQAANEKSAQRQAADQKKRQDAYKQSLNATVSAAASGFMTVYQAQSDARIEAIDKELEALQTWKDAQIAALDEASMTDELRLHKKQVLELQTAQQQEQLEQKRREEQTRAAEFEKRWSLAQIAINTAVAVMKAAGALPPPFNIPLIALAVAQGAIQAAVVQATPIPQYAEGGRNVPGGLSLVGDALRREVVENPDGSVSITPARPTLVNLQKGANVYKSLEAFAKQGIDSTIGSSRDIGRFIRSRDIDTDRIVGAIASNRSSVRLDISDGAIKYLYKNHERRVKVLTKRLFYNDR